MKIALPAGRTPPPLPKTKTNIEKRKWKSKPSLAIDKTRTLFPCRCSHYGRTRRETKSNQQRQPPHKYRQRYNSTTTPTSSSSLAAGIALPFLATPSEDNSCCHPFPAPPPPPSPFRKLVSSPSSLSAVTVSPASAILACSVQRSRMDGRWGGGGRGVT